MPHPTLRSCAVWTLAAVTGACSSTPSEDAGEDVVLIDTGGDATDADADTADADTADDARDAAVDDDAAADASGLAAFGEPCVASGECGAGVCAYIAAGLDEGFCTGPCIVSENCPSEWSCVLLARSGADAAFLCVPDDLCIDGDDDRFGVGPGCRGPDCDDENPVVYLGADEVCDGLDNDCDGLFDDNTLDANQDCSTGFSGVCAGGRSQCVGGLLSCAPLRPASVEVCDGLDNDCDGAVDRTADGSALAEACYGGPPATRGVGACVDGARACVDGALSICDGQVLPGSELCDGLDNDCDANVDEGQPGAGLACDTGLDGVCAAGLTACGDAATTCIARNTPSDEICDGLDNDCDGAVDEGSDGAALRRDCYTGPTGTEDVGVCAGGTQACTRGEWGRCEGQVLPGPELCSAFDENCDGRNNEDDPASGLRCATGDLGLCAFGRTACAEGVDASFCVADFEPAAEVCDGFDNDCNGDSDEDESGQPIRRFCYDGPSGTSGIGQCRAGEQQCTAGSFGGCVGQVLPGVEVCDGFDNDCDGGEDDGDPGGGIACTTGLPGACNVGVTRCTGGRVVCEATTTGSDEVCDGADNDCDGDVDEGTDWENLGDVCFAGQGVCRAPGTFVCDPSDPTAATVCSAMPREGSDETCDGADNDCDGDIDEEPQWSNLNAVCFAGDGVCRAPGTFVCDGADPAGPTVCSAVPREGGDEVCDGADNDCDGDIDEEPQWSNLNTVCFAGEGVCRAPGTFACDVSNPGGPTVCNAAPREGSDELCDGFDNDCDGDVDEGVQWDDVGEVCSVGAGACLRFGVRVCDAADPAGSPVCSVAPGPSSDEVCDGVDNDCDNDIDEAFAGLGAVCFAGDGVCRAAGRVECASATTTACSAVPDDPPSSDELACDYVDDDCDGTVDEDFRTGAVYGQVDHCGGCGVRCADLWDGGPAAFNVVPQCNVFGVAASCGYACATGWFDIDRDPSNGCEFQPDPGAVYVRTASAGGVDGASCGTFNAPCATLGYAIANRADPTSRPRVRVADGAWFENVTLRNGVSLLGGHNGVNWVRNPSVNVSAIAGQNTALHNSAVVATGITLPTELSGFTITAAPGRAGGGNSVGVYVRNATNALVVENNRIFASSGGPGASGNAGVGGANGVNGEPGSTNVTRTNGCGTFSIGGGARGERQCVDPDTGASRNVHGGRGATSECPSEDVQATSGATGSGTAPGTGGVGGWHLVGSSSIFGTTCTPGDGPIDARPGLNATSGADGSRGTGAALALGAVSSGVWAAARGGDATSGANGSGGGGGGAAAGVYVNNNTRYFGASGGGGGSGGCAGGRGLGGSGGGGSFAVFVTFDSPPASAAVVPVIRNNALSRGQGGVGGAGGNGGAGGEPGLGGGGGPGTDSGTFGFCMLDAGGGGAGSRGGHGGGGGGGAGGVSFDIFVAGVGSVTPTFPGNTFAQAAATDTGGTGGAGGQSNNTDRSGTAGGAGAFGQVRLAP